MGIEPEGLAWDALAIRFAAFQPGVSTAIVGTASAEHLARCAGFVREGALPEPRARAIREAFRQHDRGWVGQV
jgi:aryl-alcohol dehydrogenase-like predicted oxidoreductase